MTLVTLDSVSAHQSATAVTDLSWTHSCVAPQDGYLLVWTTRGFGTLASAQSVTYNGASLTLLGSQNITRDVYFDVWGYQGTLFTAPTTLTFHSGQAETLIAIAAVFNHVSTAGTVQTAAYGAGLSQITFTASPGADPGGLMVLGVETKSDDVTSTVTGTEVHLEVMTGVWSLGVATGDSGAWNVASATTANSHVLAVPLTAASPVIAPTGLASAASFGGATLTPGAITLSPLGLSSHAALGSALVAPELAPTGLASGAALGAAVLTLSLARIEPVGIAGGALGAPSVRGQIGPPGLASGAAVGQPGLASVVAPPGLASAAAFGALTFTTTARLTLTGLPAGSALGAASVTPSAVTLTPVGLPAGPVADPVVGNPVAPAGLASGAAFGVAALTRGPAQARPPGLAAGAVGTPRVLPAPVVGAPLAPVFSATLAGAPTLTGAPGLGAVFTAWPTLTEQV